MAKKSEAELEVVEGGEAEEAQTQEQADGRHIWIEDPDTKERVKRVDWIRKVYAEEGGEYYGDRGKIARKLTEIQGKKVPYQIVFAATNTKELRKIKRPEPAPEAEADTEAGNDAA